ncbi:MAG: peptidoglycan editing factor PgeF [Rubrivivax sp.]|nr:peptidoglycan editing factor PgeF [Rubrivivax sp.]
MTTRAGGVSRGEWASLNLGRSVGDAPEAVAENRRRFAASLRRQGAAGAASREPAARPVWLQQVHGNRVIELDASTPERAPVPADAAWTRVPGIACVVGAADCLPVLLAARDGRAVAAAHAGWRGLAAGVIENTVQALMEALAVRPDDLLTWLGPCIGPRRFEVGADVLQAFGHAAAGPGAGVPGEEGAALNAPQWCRHFTYRPRADGSPRWLADLQGLARERLQRLGVTEISAEDACTYEEASRLFSFRRDGRSGRMAAAIWIDG